MYGHYLRKKNFETIQSFSSTLIIERFSGRGGRLIMKIILIQVKLSLTTTIKRENRGPVWDKPVPDFQLGFCPNLL